VELLRPAPTTTQNFTGTAFAYHNPLGIGSLPASICEVTLSDSFIISGSGADVLTLFLDGEAEADPSFYINGVLDGMCGSAGCSLASSAGGENIPVVLGVPFQVTLVANASYAPTGCCVSSSDILAHAEADDIVDSLREYQTISEFVAPEPGMAWLALFGLIAIAVSFWISQRSIGNGVVR